jgi:hypothetical protein
MAIGIPNVADVVRGWLSTMKAEKVTSVIVNGDVEEITTPVTFKGMIQVQSPYKLSLHQEGERSWNWCDVYCDYADFNLDDIFIYNNKNYRVMKKDNWEEYGYGYYKYECVRDYND